MIDWENHDIHKFSTLGGDSNGQKKLATETPQGEREDANARMSIEELEASAFSEYSEDSFYGDENDREFKPTLRTRVAGYIRAKLASPPKNAGIWILAGIFCAATVLFFGMVAAFVYFRR